MTKSMEKPTLTLILFCYNHELYIEEALKSALEQDFEPLEIIVSDDCSTDNTFKIAESICKNYHGVKKLTVRRNEINIGLANNIKEAVAISTGRYLIMSSSGIERECETVRLLNEKRVNSIIMSLNCGGIGKGATYAYRRDVFKSFDPLPQFIKSEDKILPLVASLIGSVFYIPEKTIYYRLPIGSLSRNLEGLKKIFLKIASFYITYC
jgi:glycosyltransferase involved in cell wall biosynthesis